MFCGKYFLHAMSLYPLQIVLELYVAPLNMNTESKLCFVVFVVFFQSAAAAPSPVMGNMPPNDGMPGGPMPPGFFQVRKRTCSS